jgi:glutamyl-Q tRNA(Asp) synthetase
MSVTTRFAPSPTGRLHLGHAYSAILNFQFAQAHGGRFLLRIEDIDPTRCRADFIAGITEDLAWLGLHWEPPVRQQSQHMADYAAALQKLDTMGLLYPCTCTRRDIADEIARAGYAPQGPDGLVYPGICKPKTGVDLRQPHALRLHMDRAIHMAGQAYAGAAAFGDVVLARKETPASYHLAVTVDDALQGVTHVIRGEDLAAATQVHKLLQSLLGLPTPAYQHHALITDARGARLAKRDGAPALQALRERGVSPAQVYQMLKL